MIGGTVLEPGRIFLSPEEHESVEALITAHGEKVVSLTRRDPGESGPVLVQLEDDATYEVDEQGKTTKQAG
jgi:hypothetical protein